MKSIMLALLLISFSNFTYAQNYWIPVQPYPIVVSPVVVQPPQIVTMLPLVPMVQVPIVPYYVQPYYQTIITEKRGCFFPRYSTSIISYPSPPLIRY